MKKNMVIFGSTGMLGQALILESLEDPNIEHILLINRRKSGNTHPKIREYIVADLFDLEVFDSLEIPVDACCFCLGTTSVGKTEEQYHRITYELTHSIARRLHRFNPGMTFLYISGAGTDSSEKGRSMWARVKGKTENMILDLFKESYMFRPGYIQPLKGVRSSTNWYRWAYQVFGLFYPIMKRLAPRMLISSVELSNAMLNAIHYGYHIKVLETPDIVELAQYKENAPED